MTACPEKCWDEKHEVFPKPKNNTEYNTDMKTTGWIAVWHCLQPFVVTFIVFLSMKNKDHNYKRFKLPNVDNCCCCGLFVLLWFVMRTLGNCLLSLASILPMPVFTHIYIFYLNVSSHIARSNPKFKEKMGKWERKIEEYEALGKPCFPI